MFKDSGQQGGMRKSISLALGPDLGGDADGGSKNVHLVQWYFKKLQVSECYSKTTQQASIVMIQRIARGFLGRLSFKRFLRNRMNDPLSRFRQLQRALGRIEDRIAQHGHKLERLERVNNCREPTSEVNESRGNFTILAPLP